MPEVGITGGRSRHPLDVVSLPRATSPRASERGHYSTVPLASPQFSLRDGERLSLFRRIDRNARKNRQSTAQNTASCEERSRARWMR